MAERSRRSRDELEGLIGGNMDGQQMGGTHLHTCALCSHVHAHIHMVFVCGCAYMHAYMSRQQVCAYMRSHVCVQASVSVYLCSPKPTHI